ncbi:transketolase [Floccifex sp.]|uniref:transketolase n=1 Tax=Floccifex sp. TaxID=2815810 RepID=UPI002A75FFA0|nr:transketolase [Floccifex sp.]MDD7280899.1 transketolase [Erysipelotrichaceae bacterium]MDY2958570.1 transketolase [Floccifex sp.]
MENKELSYHAKNIRKNILKQVYQAQSGHPGGSLGAADIITMLYFEEMNINAENLDTINRDRFVLSKGHASPCLYAALAEKGFMPEEELLTFRAINSKLQGHPNMNYVKGVDMSTGSLGQGVSCAVGMALANKLDKNDYRVYALLGDGECQEGQVWEATMSAAHYKLDNLCIIVDANNLQIDGHVSDVMNVYPLDDKFKAFNCHTICVDGHNFDELRSAFKEAREVKGKPTVIIAKTVKGKGVSFMEDQAGWHGVAPNEQQYHDAIKELEAE